MGIIYNKAVEFTDGEYLNKKEIANKIGSSNVDVVWKDTNDYRELYRFSLPLKRSDNVPFTICLTPAILAYCTTSEKELYNFKSKYEKLDIVSKLTGNFNLDNAKKDLLVNDIFQVSRNLGIEVSKADIKLILETRMGNIKLMNDLVLAFNATIDYKRDVDSQFVNMLDDLLEHNNGKYREDLTNEFSEEKIKESLNCLDEFIDEQYNFSPLLISALIYGYICYVRPFASYSHLVGLLASIKYLDNYGFGECVFYTGIIDNLINNKPYTDNSLNDSTNYGDFTYFMISFLQLFIESIDRANLRIDQIPMPDYSKEMPKIVEKIVEVPVEKIVEKIVEVPVDKISNKNEEDDLDKVMAESYKGRTNSYLNKEYKKKEVKRNEYDFIDDPFKSANEILEVMDMSKLVYPYIDLPANQLAIELMHINPNLKSHQALFYANHHDYGKYYTIGQFKDFASCVYETARTSMDYLVSVNLYKKLQIKNKFVYTPVLISDEE